MEAYNNLNKFKLQPNWHLGEGNEIYRRGGCWLFGGHWVWLHLGIWVTSTLQACSTFCYQYRSKFESESTNEQNFTNETAIVFMMQLKYINCIYVQIPDQTKVNMSIYDFIARSLTTGMCPFFMKPKTISWHLAMINWQDENEFNLLGLR